MEKILLIGAFCLALAFLFLRIRKSLLRIRKDDCGPDCKCEK